MLYTTAGSNKNLHAVIYSTLFNIYFLKMKFNSWSGYWKKHKRNVLTQRVTAGQRKTHKWKGSTYVFFSSLLTIHNEMEGFTWTIPHQRLLWLYSMFGRVFSCSYRQVSWRTLLSYHTVVNNTSLACQLNSLVIMHLTFLHATQVIFYYLHA